MCIRPAPLKAISVRQLCGDESHSIVIRLSIAARTRKGRIRLTDPTRLRGGEKMAVEWKKDVDAALAQAQEQNRPLLIDFSAAPA